MADTQKKEMSRGRRKRVDPLTGDPLWDLLQSLMACYPLWRSILSSLSLRSLFRKENSYLWFDVIRGLRAMPSSKAVVLRLRDVDDASLDGVIALAEINSKRQENFFRTLFLAYITVPFTLGALWAELAPGQMVDLLRNPDLAPVWGGTFAGLFSALAIRFVADWRARSFLALLQMARIERNTARASIPTQAAPAMAKPSRRTAKSPKPAP